MLGWFFRRATRSRDATPMMATAQAKDANETGRDPDGTGFALPRDLESVCFTTASAEAASRKSIASASDSAPAACTLETVSCSVSELRATTTTAEKSRAKRIAVARPMPRLAPVTIAIDWFIRALLTGDISCTDGAEPWGRRKHPSCRHPTCEYSPALVPSRRRGLAIEGKLFQVWIASSTLAVSVCMLNLASFSPRTVQTWAKAAENNRPVFLKVPE